MSEARPCQLSDQLSVRTYLTLETRRAKEERPLIEVNEGWRNTAREYGFTEHEVAKILREPRRALTPEREAKVIDAAVTQAIKSLTSQQAHFRRSDLIRDVCVATVTDGIPPERIHRRIEAVLQADCFVDLGRGDRFTTKEIFYEVEQKALEAAGRLGERAAHVVRDRTINKEIAREPRLNEGQKAAIQTVCRGPDLTLIQGAPGTGKSTLLDVVRRAVETDGGHVIGLTSSNRAARELEKNSGVESYTVHRFLYEQERTIADTAKHHAKMVVRAAFGLPTWKPPKQGINRHTTLIIDECSMVDNDLLARVLAHAEKAG
ncbi:MAG TPA: AAA family ATPase, partial [Isosphaeraceae bacterium]|nr:AAA family ATPase [Isosphaeraceae bacterium]